MSMIDLHVHLRGTLTPDQARKIALRNSRPLAQARLESVGYGWRDFSSFLQAYDEVTSVIACAADLEEVAFAYLASAASCGARYVEFMLSPPDLMRVGVAFEDQLSALSDARARAFEVHGIDCRMIATAVRHLGPEAALSAARIAVDRKHEILVGFGLTGDERQFPIAAFEEPFRIARVEGLLATAHAGEHLGPETIIEAIEVLGLSRVGHGVRAIEAPAVVKQLAEAQLPLEICLSSNVALGLYPSIQNHPLRALYDAGCVVTLGTDDPAFFATDIANEYMLAKKILPDVSAIQSIEDWSIRYSFCDDNTKATLLAIPARSAG